MRALIIYAAVYGHEAVYGNADRVAHAIADGLRPFADVRVLAAETVVPSDVQGVDLLVIGCPTSQHGDSPALRDLFERSAPAFARGRCVAAFDTRHHVSRFLGGPAAHCIERDLRRQGGYPLLPAASFFVADHWGPIEEGELGRATRWGRDLYQAYRLHAGAGMAHA